MTTSPPHLMAAVGVVLGMGPVVLTMELLCGIGMKSLQTIH